MAISFDTKKQEISQELAPYLERKQELLQDLTSLGTNEAVIDLMNSHADAGLGSRFWVNAGNRDDACPSILVIGHNDGKGIELVFQERGEGRMPAGEWLDYFEKELKRDESLVGSPALDRMQELVQKGLEAVAEDVLEAAKTLNA